MTGQVARWSFFATWLLVGCGPPSEPGSTPATDPREQSAREALILSPSALDESFLLGQQLPVRWRFLGDQFVVESWNEPLPEGLLERMLDQSGPVYRLGGHWELLEQGHRLRVSQLQADGPPVKALADLAIGVGPGDTLLVEGTPYVLSEHPGNREILPDAFFRGRLVAVQVGHLLTVEHDGPGHQVETLQLGGIVCPPAEHPIGHQAIQRAEQLMQGQRLQIKIYDQPPRAPRRAQVFTSDFYWVNLQLIEEGFAWHDKPRDHEWLFSSREDVARENRLGIWSVSDLKPPWWPQGP